MSKLILTDADETIIEFANPFQDWMETKGFVTASRLRDSYKVEEWLGVDRQTALDLMTEFGRSDAEYLMHPEPDALEILPRLRAEGYRVNIITACGTCPIYAARRTKVLADVFGFTFDGVHYVEHRATKREVLNSFKPAIWVEDNYQHAVDGFNLSHRTFLLDRAYNQGPHPLNEQDTALDAKVCTMMHLKPLCDRFKRVASWHDIYAGLHQ